MFGVSKIMFKTFKEQRFCNKYNLKTKKNILEDIMYEREKIQSGG
jgi:hypothetical protein